MTKTEKINNSMFLKDGITNRQLVMYAGASGDFCELHYSESFAKQAGYKDIIVHGMLNMGIAARYIEMLLDEGQELSFLKVRFQSVVYPDDKIIFQVQINEKDGVNEVFAKNQDGAMVLSGEFGTVNR